MTVDSIDVMINEYEDVYIDSRLTLLLIGSVDITTVNQIYIHRFICMWMYILMVVSHYYLLVVSMSRL